MPDIAYEDSVLGESVLAFDGRILEQFTWQSASTGRLISSQLHVEVKGPDRKGRRSIMFTTRPSGRGGGFHASVDEAGWALIEPLVEQLQAL